MLCDTMAAAAATTTTEYARDLCRPGEPFRREFKGKGLRLEVFRNRAGNKVVCAVHVHLVDEPDGTVHTVISEVPVAEDVTLHAMLASEKWSEGHETNRMLSNELLYCLYQLITKVERLEADPGSWRVPNEDLETRAAIALMSGPPRNFNTGKIIRMPAITHVFFTKPTGGGLKVNGVKIF